MFKDSIRILLAEDDLNLGTLLVDYLQKEGFQVKLCNDGILALKAYMDQEFDICLFDVMMPKLDGFSLIREIRLMNKKTPVIFITAKSLKEDKLKAYGLGADDFITKPFDEEELLWKIRAVARRVAPSSSKNAFSLISIGKFKFDYINQSLILGEKKRRITEKECRIMKYLSDHRNIIIKRQELLKHIWGEDDYFAGRSLDVFISKIRRYLEDDPEINIENVFGVGFIFNVIVE